METIGRDLREMQRVPLQPAHIASIRAAGTRTQYRKGTTLTEIGASADRSGASCCSFSPGPACVRA